MLPVLGHSPISYVTLSLSLCFEWTIQQILHWNWISLAFPPLLQQSPVKTISSPYLLTLLQVQIVFLSDLLPTKHGLSLTPTHFRSPLSVCSYYFWLKINIHSSENSLPNVLMALKHKLRTLQWTNVYSNFLNWKYARKKETHLQSAWH